MASGRSLPSATKRWTSPRPTSGQTVFTVGVADDPKPAKLDDEKEWFDTVKRSLVQSVMSEPTAEVPVKHEAKDLPGRQWQFHNNRHPVPSDSSLEHIYTEASGFDRSARTGITINETGGDEAFSLWQPTHFFYIYVKL